MKVVVVLARKPYFSAGEREVLQRVVDALGTFVEQRQLPCVVCAAEAPGIRVPQAMTLNQTGSTKDLIRPEDVVVTQYSTVIFDIREFSNKLVLLNNKATSYLLTFPWVINHELQVEPVMNDVLAAASPTQAIWDILNNERTFDDKVQGAPATVSRVMMALKVLKDRFRG